MPRTIPIQYEHAYYHVMNRGRARQPIFHGAGYYEDFLTTLEDSLKDIAKHFSLTNSGSVSHSISAMKTRLEGKEFHKEYRQLE